MPQKDPSKTEKATSKRRNKVRGEGNVPKSDEFTKAITLLMALIALRFLIGFYHDQFAEIYEWTFREAIHMEIDKNTAYSLFVWGVKKLGIIVLPLVLVLASVAYVTLRLQVGKLWSNKAMNPNFGKLFNITGALQKLFISPQAAINLGKSILTALAVGIAPYIVIKQEMHNLLPLFYANTHGIISFLLSVGYKMTFYALIPMMLIGIAHLWYTRWNYEEEIKMSKEEIKDEQKQAEGDPAIKMKQKQKMMEMITSRMFQDIPKADVVVTNPTHFAVALQYDALIAPAPLVLAKGVNRVAERIKEVAKEHNVPIEANPPLARALYKQVEIGETIPEELFQAVAALLAKLDKFKKR
ncbi:flagellar type III secretion system protein FlhB [Pseudodesulfovibrio sp. zrk46]|uniref:flagellar type III secretion system protein FlhB n=1 Tax=Pseudodesulfovibrio sp. zrk46 TaxID=2725288 RepID=UPI001449DF70|nr:flagellar type III secretion system protein FlhB [Pseudodesulfovibrio sp. zrk46]QJB57946.1 flagellar biosynthesis protein FlhB [Pseudodesulfovibrio sp. zrk46]